MQVFLVIAKGENKYVYEVWNNVAICKILLAHHSRASVIFFIGH